MISEIITLLEASGEFAAVELAEDQTVLHRPAGKPSGTVFVMPYTERADPNALITGFRQQVTEQIVTAILVRRNDDPRGAVRAKKLARYKAAIEEVLAGWQPPGDRAPLELVGGAGSALGDNISIHVQTWETNRYLSRSSA